MARGVNKVILVGNLGQDPEVKYMPSGQAVCNVSIATSESWNDKNTGEKQERTEWHRVVFFRKLAEIVGEYLRKDLCRRSITNTQVARSKRRRSVHNRDRC